MRTNILAAGILCSIALSICVLDESAGNLYLEGLSSSPGSSVAHGQTPESKKTPVYIALVSYPGFTDDARDTLGPALNEIIQTDVTPVLEHGDTCDYQVHLGLGIRLLANLPAQGNSLKPAVVCFVCPIAAFVLVVI